MLKLIHAADFHLDAPFAALSPEQAAQRRAEQRQLLTRLADLAIEQRADLVLLSGDLLDDRETYYETAQVLAGALGRIPAPVFIAPGNHDFYQARSLYAGGLWPENVHIFTSANLESVELPQLNCVVHGAAFVAPYADNSLLTGFWVPADGKLHLMVLHGDVDGGGRYGTLSREDIAESGLTYLALGHVHTCSGLQWAGKTCWAYPGCPEGRGFDELGDKGVLAVSIDGGEVSARFVPLAGRRYGVLRVDLTGAESAEWALLSALPEGTEKDIYRIILTGERTEAPDLDALKARVQTRFYSVTLRDESRPRRNLWERMGEDNLTGLFLREMKTRLDSAADAEERRQIEQAARFGLAALEKGEDPCL